jgi:hypothetical protein
MSEPEGSARGTMLRVRKDSAAVTLGISNDFNPLRCPELPLRCAQPGKGIGGYSIFFRQTPPTFLHRTWCLGFSTEDGAASRRNDFEEEA